MPAARLRTAIATAGLAVVAGEATKEPCNNKLANRTLKGWLRLLLDEASGTNNSKHNVMNGFASPVRTTAERAV